MSSRGSCGRAGRSPRSSSPCRGAPITRALWTLYTRVGLPALGRLASRDWYDVGRFLGPSISGFYRRYPLTALAELWRRAGIGDVETRVMSLGGGVVMWGVREDGGVAAA